jgi:cytochrome bd-type quinol oxidase subunit 2
MEKKVTSSALMGLLVALVLIVFSLIMYFADLYTEQWNQWAGLIILVASIIFAVLFSAKERDHQVTFGSLFGFGVKVAAASTCIMILYMLLQGVVFPDIKTRIMEMSRAQALKQPGVSEADVDRYMEMFERNYTLFMVIGVLFWNMLIGVVASLVGAAVAKKRPVAEFDNI